MIHSLLNFFSHLRSPSMHASVAPPQPDTFDIACLRDYRRQKCQKGISKSRGSARECKCLVSNVRESSIDTVPLPSWSCPPFISCDKPPMASYNNELVGPDRDGREGFLSQVEKLSLRVNEDPTTSQRQENRDAFPNNKKRPNPDLGTASCCAALVFLDAVPSSEFARCPWP